MNVYEKLNLARLKFQSGNVKMSGRNDYAGYEYYDLADILPKINEICSEVKCTCIVSFDNQIGKLDFVDCEKPEDKITFTSPMSEASLKGCHAVQNLGAVETYLKRYLYQNCFEIIEHDCLDTTMNPKSNQTQKTGYHNQQEAPNNATYNQNVKRITELCLAIEGYINAGLLTGGYKEKAEWNMKNRNLEALENTVAWCKEQEKKGA